VAYPTIAFSGAPVSFTTNYTYTAALGGYLKTAALGPRLRGDDRAEAVD
jgi:hypothetical protein